MNTSQFDTALGHVHRFEEDLAADGALILKFWIHLPKKEQQKRFKQVKKNPDRAWRLSKNDWKIYRKYDKLMPVVQHALRKTSTVYATWNIVEGTDSRYRDLAVMKTILEAVNARLAQEQAEPAGESEEMPASLSTSLGEGALSAVDLAATIPHPEYKKKLTRSQARLSRLAREAYQQGVSSVLVFEGWDAAGKGGVIRRITRAMSAQTYRIVRIAAPTDEEKAHHYLWRFWRRLPRAGRMLILDRSWYGRVLVERVEGFARTDEWQRAYEEINDFEEQLVEHGTPVMKFWLHVDPDEQLRRFREREKTPYKKYKITDEDYRNRQRWDDYVVAVNEMVARTSTELAPWTLVPANDKRWARLSVLKTVNRTLKQTLKG